MGFCVEAQDVGVQRLCGTRRPTADPPRREVLLEERFERGVERPVPRVQVIVERAPLRVGERGLDARPGHRQAGGADVGMQPGARGGQHRGAAGGGLDVVGPGDREAGDVRPGLSPSAAFGLF